VGVFLSRKHSPDAQGGGTGRWPLASGGLSGVAECTGRTGESPVCGHFAKLSRYEFSEHRTVRCSTSGDPEVLHTSMSFSPDAYDVDLQSVRCFAGSC